MRRTESRRDIVITGFGIVCPLATTLTELVRRFEQGDRVAPSAALAGRGALTEEIPLDVVPHDQRGRVGRLDRLCRLYLSASYMALDSAGLSPARPIGGHDPARCAISFGTGLGCVLTNAAYNRKFVERGARAASPQLFAYTVSSAAAGEVSIALGITGPNLTAHHGVAAGLGALGYAADLIELGKADLVLAGGADACGPDLVDALDEIGALSVRPRSGTGVFPSEAAVVAILEDGEHARRRGARILAHVDGYAAGFEPSLATRERMPDGIESTASRALERSGRGAAEISTVWPSACGTALEELERRALTRALGPRGTAVIRPSKPALGETFAAAGMLALALGVTSSGETAGARDTVAMIHSLCYSGNTVATIVSRQ